MAKLEATLAALMLICSTAQAQTLWLQTNWRIEDSAQVADDGALVSQPGFDDQTWIPASVPSTILGNLVPPTTGSGSADDPFMGENLLKLPGSGAYYPVGKNYGDVVTPPESPFGRPWWYRKTFSLNPLSPGQHVDLEFHGLTYGAEIWLNGKKLADFSETRGTYRTFTYDITPDLRSDGAENALAVLVHPPLPTDLTPSWVDWNPTPQDKNMGLWREVVLRVRGPVRLEHPMVTSDFDLPAAAQARLTVEAELTNTENQPVHGVLRGRIGSISFEQSIDLAPSEHRTIKLTPQDIPSLEIKNPRLWWPWQMGEPALYHLSLEYDVGQTASDKSETDFGIRKIESKLTKTGARLFLINGKRILIRGGGWASDLFLRFSRKRERRELQYVRDLGLNTVRLEGRFEPQSFLDLTDRMGILVMPGWVCCNAWQSNQNWDSANYEIAAASIRDQIYEFRSHASVFTFLYGSDEAPPPQIEKIYTDAFKTYDWPNPIIASASTTESPETGKTGFKMNGPYDYTPPSYWYVDKSYGGAWGFNTETSPGASMPPMESIEKFIPPDHLSCVDDTWIFHTGGNEFHSLDTLKEAEKRRFGETLPDVSVEDFVERAQLLSYDNHRAMFEAFGRNKYRPATGIIQWMLNNAWPSLIWHLWDYELRPNAAYYGVKKATAPIHVQYSYDDQSIVVVNSTYAPVPYARVSARTFDTELHPLEMKTGTVSVASDSTQRLFKMKIPSGERGRTYFLKLELRDASGSLVDENFYWLSNRAEIYDWDKTDYRITPVTQEADLKALTRLPPAEISTSTSWDPATGSGVVQVKNTGRSLALFVRLKLMQGNQEVLPVFWGDNYISLLPGEARTISVSAPDAVASLPVSIETTGWLNQPSRERSASVSSANSSAEQFWRYGSSLSIKVSNSKGF